MPLPKDFDKTLVGKTDESLYEVPVPPVDYFPEALPALPAGRYFSAATLNQRKSHSLRRSLRLFVLQSCKWKTEPFVDTIFYKKLLVCIKLRLPINKGGNQYATSEISILR